MRRVRTWRGRWITIPVGGGGVDGDLSVLRRQED
jgi:hypothetical protein